MATTSAAAPRVRAARPMLRVDGQDQPSLAQGLLELVVAEDAGGLYRCEAKLGNWGPVGSGIDLLYLDRTLLDFGKALEVRLGTDVLFEGRVTALEARFPEGSPPELTVLAEDRLQDLRMTRRTRTFANASDADVVRQVASDHGLGADVDAPGPTHAVIAQVNQSDLALVRDRCRAIDAHVWVEGRTLKARSRASLRGSPLPLAYGAALHQVTVTADLAHQRTEVAVTGWDVAGKAAIREAATDAAIRPELDGGASGASVLSAALGARKEVLVHTAPASGAEARARAEAHFRAAARRFLVARGVAETDPGLRVGATVELQRLGGMLSGKYHLVSVAHLFDGTGLRTEFVAERPGLGAP